MKNREYSEKLDKLFKKYELKDIISTDDQQFILNEKIKVFNKVMGSVKKIGKVTLIFSGIYFFLKKHTLLSIILQKMTAILIASSLIGGTSYIVYKQFIKNHLNRTKTETENIIPQNDTQTKVINENIEQNAQKENSSEQLSTDANKASDAKITIDQKSEVIDYDSIKYDIRIKTFRSTALEKTELSKMAEEFKIQLQKNQSEKYAIVSNRINSSNCDHVLSVSIEEYDGEFVFNVKMIDINTSKIEMLSEYTADSVDNFEKLWPQISKDVRSILE